VLGVAWEKLEEEDNGVQEEEERGRQRGLYREKGEKQKHRGSECEDSKQAMELCVQGDL
jgi:hypothetical protein